MNNKQMVEIPEDIALQLTDLLVLKGIREELLVKLVDDPNRYDSVEKSLIDIIKKIDMIKSKINWNHIPEEFSSNKFSWKYNGYEIDGAYVEIIKN